MPVSPRTEAFMQPPPAEEDAVQAFEDGFGQMAQQVFTKKFPDLVDSLVTFKIITSDIDAGSAVGAFVLHIGGETVFVPTVLAQNRVKPMEILYFKDKNVFLPLSPEWIDEISRDAVDELGTPITAPETLQPDRDIRKAIVPPIMGRYAYAAGEEGIRLSHFLLDAPNHVKKAFQTVLLRNRKVLKFAYEKLNGPAIIEALKPKMEKKAAAPRIDAVLLTPDNSADEFRAVFGKWAGQAFQEAIKEGYVIRDEREHTKLAIEAEIPLRLTTPQEAGFYRVHLRGGGTKKALIVPNPQLLESPLYAAPRTDQSKIPDVYKQNVKKKLKNMIEGEEQANADRAHKPQFLVYTEDGQAYLTPECAVGEILPLEIIKMEGGKLADLVSADDSPAKNGYGFFVTFRAATPQATVPFMVDMVTTGSDGARRIRTGSRTLVTDPKAKVNSIVAPKGSNVAYIPTRFRFIKADFGNPDELLFGASATLSHLKSMLTKTGAPRLVIKNAGAGSFVLGDTRPMDKVAMVRCLVGVVGLRPKEATSLLKKAEARGSHSFYLVNRNQLVKFAQGAMMPGQMPPEGAMPPPGAEGGMPTGAEGEMPPGAEGGMPPEMMGGMPPEAMAPPPPNPVEMAAVEVGSQLASQAAQVAQQLADQQRDLSNQLHAINAVKQRAEQIAMEQQGGPPVGELPPIPQEPGLAVSPPGATPDMMAEGGMPPAGPEAGMPPAGPGPEAGMPPVEEGQSMELANQAEAPMEDAAALEDPEAFEATAIAALTAGQDLRQLASTYMADLEEALDKLGRMLLTLWINEADMKQQVGEQDFNQLEENMLSVFKNLGKLILMINQTSMPDKQEMA